MLDDLVSRCTVHRYGQSTKKIYQDEVLYNDIAITRKFNILNDLGMILKWPSCNIKGLKRNDKK